MGIYDGPPEPEFQGEDHFTCSMEVERQFITPQMRAWLVLLRDGPNTDPWTGQRTPDERRQIADSQRRRAVDEILNEWRRTEEVLVTCGWSGVTSYTVWGGDIMWDCPACGEAHNDGPAIDRWGPDPEARDEDDDR